MIGAIHVYEIVSRSAPSVNAEGLVTAASVTTSVRGRVDELRAADVTIAAQVGQTHDIACEADLDVVVTDRDLVIVTDPTRLAGTYRVDAVRTTRKKLRILCSRFTAGRG